MKSGSLINNYTLLLSMFMFASGIWGLFTETIFAVMSTNLTHAVIHISLGAFGIILSLTHRAHGYLLFVGLLLAVVGVVYMIPATSYLVVNLLNVNSFTAVFNVMAGVFAILVASVGTRYTYLNN